MRKPNGLLIVLLLEFAKEICARARETHVSIYSQFPIVARESGVFYMLSGNDNHLFTVTRLNAITP
jgi:hypothetical protein